MRPRKQIIPELSGSAVTGAKGALRIYSTRKLGFHPVGSITKTAQLLALKQLWICNQIAYPTVDL